MKPFDQTHLILLMATVAFVAVTMYAASKLSHRGQNVLFALGAILCAGGIFFRYAMGASFSFEKLDVQTLGIQMLQVCNFNFLLVLLMLVPKFELARQYSFMFSMFAAATVMLSFPKSWASLKWYDTTVLNFWFNHVFAIALPLWMLAAGRLKPQKKYILPVSVCVIAYFLIVYGCTEWLLAKGLVTADNTFSYVYDPEGVGLLESLYKLIPVPCFYLAPLIPAMLGFFWALTWLFKNYNVQRYGRKFTVKLDK